MQRIELQLDGVTRPVGHAQERRATVVGRGVSEVEPRNTRICARREVCRHVGERVQLRRRLTGGRQGQQHGQSHDAAPEDGTGSAEHVCEHDFVLQMDVKTTCCLRVVQFGGRICSSGLYILPYLRQNVNTNLE